MDDATPVRHSPAGGEAEGGDGALAAAVQAARGRALSPAEADALRQIAADIPDAEWPAEAGPLAEAVRALLELAAFGAGDAQVRLAPAGSLEVLLATQADSPFLVDSLMGELADANLQVRAMAHPLVEDGARKRSMILVLLDPVGEDRAERLLEEVRRTFADVHAAVDDLPAMRSLMRQAVSDLEAAGKGDGEALDFLRWLTPDTFVFLGARVYEYPRAADGGYAAEEPLFQPQDSLGVLRDRDRSVLRRASEPAVLTHAMIDRLAPHLEAPVTVAKANLRSRVHRRAYMDYVGVRRYGPDGRPSGEVRFVGLFTDLAYDQPARETPWLRARLAAVIARAGVEPGSHNDKRLRSILEGWPRDELFQSGEDELLHTALGVLRLYDRPRVAVFTRRDPFDRFVSVLLFIPRDRYTSGVRARAGEILAKAYAGRVSAYYPSFSDLPLARVHFIIGVEPGAHPEPDLAAVQAEITEAARTFDDRFEAAVRAGGAPGDEVAHLLNSYGGAFPAGYQAAFDAQEAMADVTEIEALDAVEGDAPVRLRAYRRSGDSAKQFRFKLYRRREAAPLSDVLPILENMGLRALTEQGFPVTRTDAEVVWVHDFLLEDEQGERLAFADVQDPFEAAFTAVWTGQTESDGFNRLVLELGVSWREAALVRTLARYRQQSGLDPSQAVQEQALRDNPGVARLILELFRTRLDPAISAEAKARTEQAKAVFDRVVEALQKVESVDADRALRRLALLVQQIQRTNFYQTGEDGRPKPHISIKISSRELEDLPAPKPFREIFVWAPHVEGVHLRFGPVARGGLRWSDRRDDFRTEVLGLVKAQQVKNAVIVPVGSKGGFYPKALPRGGAPDAVRAEGVRAYRTFLSGLLDITDNLNAAGKVVRPADVVALDGDDPYLVVAADKGTATFSDIANGVAKDYGFWLGDAFASGGSVGYDHKAMGITARGAWEAVKRHFRERGKDIQSEPFTAVGVGDMSGDVFGNGMLLSEQTRLLAAFDHRHIFIDPDPDAAESFAERKRLFDLPRSSWDDYDKGKISKGGGVWPRTAKQVPVSPEARAVLGLNADTVTPVELMRAILLAEAELLYLGGIGTYVKAQRESNADAGDKSNDSIRVDGQDLRVKVVGEGANLGFTQAGRIEFAQRGAGGEGGRINTDAIDNSAGVDTSDHEVNIKILIDGAMRAGAGPKDDAEREALLASMTEEVGQHVLKHNYDQTLALSLMQADGEAGLDVYARFMRTLEGKGRLDRKVEGLPGAQALADRQQAGQSLTRPELAVLLAYGKLDLFDEIVAGSAIDDSHFQGTLKAYFPDELAPLEGEMKRHRLRREIVATVVDNRMVNLCGPTFPERLRAAAACDTDALVTAFTAAGEALSFDPLWAQVEALDGQAPAEGQLALFRELSHVLRGLTFWLARRAKGGGDRGQRPGVSALIGSYKPWVEALRGETPAMLSAFEQEQVQARVQRFVDAGAPQALAAEVGALRPLTTACDLVDLGEASSWSVLATGRLYHQVGAAFGFDRLRYAAGGQSAGDPFERLAMRRLIEDLLAEQTTLTRAIMKFAGGADAGADAEHAQQAVDSWRALHPEAAQQVRRTVEEIESAGGGWSFAKLTIANAALRELVAAA